jgi:hypothetical protein
MTLDAPEREGEEERPPRWKADPRRPAMASSHRHGGRVIVNGMP